MAADIKAWAVMRVRQAAARHDEARKRYDAALQDLLSVLVDRISEDTRRQYVNWKMCQPRDS